MFLCPFRSIIPDVALTSDLIVGFCGETDADFAATLSLIETVGYHKCFMYPYSLR
jgi:tRNA A37 methylthiotransferase MiaB